MPVKPASNTKGRQDVPKWRDPAWARQNWQDVRRYGRRYWLAALVTGLAVIWLTGYAMGLIDGHRGCDIFAGCPERKQGVE